MSQVNSVNGNTLLFTGFYPPCRAATIGVAIALDGLVTLDGVALNAGDRVLVKDQPDATTNGIYAASSGLWVRTSDALSNAQFYDGMSVMVAQGAVNAASLFLCTTTDDPVIIGTSSITFVSLSTINTVSPAMRPVVQATTLAAARSALGLGSAALESFGRYGLVDDGAGFLNPTGPVSGVTSHNVTATDNNGFFVASGAATFALPLGDLLPNGFRVHVYVPAGATATLTPNVLDHFVGQSAGVAKSIPAGKLVMITCDGGAPATWYASPQGGWVNTPLAITSATPISNLHKGLTLQLGGGAMYPVTFPAGASLDPDFTCVIENTDSGIGKGIAGVGSGFTLYPGESYLVYNDSNTLKLLGGGVRRYKRSSLNLLVDNVNGSNNPTIADGLASGTRAFASIGAAVNALYTLFDHNGSQPVITIANGNYAESINVFGTPVGCNVFFLNGASSQGVVWTPASSATPYCLLVGDGGIIEYSNILGSSGSFAAVFLQLHQEAIADQNGGCGFGSFSGGTHVATDGAGWTFNINAGYGVNSGSTGTHVSATSPGICNHAGAVTITITGAPTLANWFRAASGGMISLGSSITWSGSLAAGCQKWQVLPGSVLSSSGNAANIPGSVAGSPTIATAPGAASGWVT